MDSKAYLTNHGEYTIFSYGDKTITFLTSKSLEKYTAVREWDNGYIVVMSKRKGQPEQEDYIDLNPILENLLMDPEKFLNPIKEVELQYAGK